MQFGTPIVHRCPKCKKLVLEKTLKETSADGAVCYSDSRIEAPNHPTLPIFSRCPICGAYLWVTELPALTVDDGITEAEVAKAPYFQMLSVDEIAGFLTSGSVKTKEQEYKVRVALYWNYNDRIRHLTSASSAELDAALWRDDEDKARWRDNILKLYELAKELTPEETPFFAELLREMGRFEEALAILDSAAEDSTYDKANDAVRTLCELRNPYVFIA